MAVEASNTGQSPHARQMKSVNLHMHFGMDVIARISHSPEFLAEDALGLAIRRVRRQWQAGRAEVAAGLTLLIDLGTNRQVALGTLARRLACSTTAGTPALLHDWPERARAMGSIHFTGLLRAHLQRSAAQSLGLPPIRRPQLVQPSNLALVGASTAPLQPERRAEFEEVAELVQEVLLNDQTGFAGRFVAGMELSPWR